MTEVVLGIVGETFLCIGHQRETVRENPRQRTCADKDECGLSAKFGPARNRACGVCGTVFMTADPNAPCSSKCRDDRRKLRRKQTDARRRKRGLKIKSTTKMEVFARHAGKPCHWCHLPFPEDSARKPAHYQDPTRKTVEHLLNSRTEATREQRQKMKHMTVSHGFCNNLREVLHDRGVHDTDSSTYRDALRESLGGRRFRRTFGQHLQESEDSVTVIT